MLSIKYSLYLKNTEIISIDQNKSEFKVLREDLIPHQMRNNPNYMTFVSWLSDRHLPLDRQNAKHLLNTMRLPQGSHLKVMILTRALSLNDCYWIKVEDEDSWDNLNLYENSFSNSLADISLTGATKSKFTLTKNKISTPETTNQGTYAKAWRKEEGITYLYKANFDRRECEAEFISSIIANKLGIEHVPYELLIEDGRILCKCPNITNLETSIIPMIHYLESLGEFPVDIFDYMTILKNDQNKFLEMLVFDGIIGNIDRHLRNWGFYMDSETTELKGLHPLFDHNCAIDVSINFKNYPSPLVNNKTTLELAQWAIKRTPHLLNNINNLAKWYNTKECEKLFKKTYSRLDELDYLKELLELVTTDKVNKIIRF